MCLYTNVPQWLNLQNFLKAINESINHTIDVTFMFIYLKCLNNKPEMETEKTTILTNHDANNKHILNMNNNTKCCEHLHIQNHTNFCDIEKFNLNTMQQHFNNDQLLLMDKFKTFPLHI